MKKLARLLVGFILELRILTNRAMTLRSLTLMLGLSGVLIGNVSRGVTTIVSDSYNVTGSGSGFALDTGVNTGINPPATRLTGTAAANLRYISTQPKAASAYTINANKLQVAAAADPGRFVLSADGTTSFNFAPALGTAAASRPTVSFTIFPPG